jgi:hypothetical protein
MSGKTTPANKAGKTAETTASKTAANTNAANTNVKAGDVPASEGEGEKPADKPAEKIAAPKAPAAAPIFKIAAKQPPKAGGKRGGKGGNSGAYLLTKLKFAEASYQHIDNFLKHILNGNYRPAYAHTSGFFATADGIGTTEAQAVPAEITARYDSLEAAIAAGDTYFSSVKGDAKITYVQNKKLEDCGYTERTSKPSQKYHSFLLCDNAEDVKAAIQHLTAFEALNPSQKGMVTFLTDGDGNVMVTPVVTKAQPAATTIKAETAETAETEADETETETETESVEA